jgi:uncharacterized protein
MISRIDLNLGHLIAVILLALAFPASLNAEQIEHITNPRENGGWVTDMVGVLDADAVAELNQMIAAAEAEMSNEIGVVFIHNSGNETPRTFALNLFNYWGIGKAESNNGLLVLMVMEARRLEMITGDGVRATLSDAWLKSMQEAEMVPEFKRGEFGKGVLTGVRLSIERLKESRERILSDEPVYEKPLSAKARDAAKDLPDWAWWILGLFGLGGGGAGFKHRRDRTCPACKTRMSMLSEAADDVHLTEGQKTEERIGSVDWQYWYCQTCNFSRLLKSGSWFSGFSKCTSCRNKTLETTNTTTRHATYTSTGSMLVTEDCRHCDFHNTFSRTIPMKTRSSSSSGSSGSFGGGSSSGGGAGSSW